MNERLEDLMYLAGLTAQGCWDSMDQYDREAIEKFAELIVRECINTLEFHGFDDAIPYVKWMATNKLGQHFGVE
jgi:hypothetical protein